MSKSTPTRPSNGPGRQRKRSAGRAAAQLRPNRGLSTNAKLTIGTLVVVLVGLVGLYVFVERAGNRPAGELVAADSHRLSSAADGKVTLVEFLDFECPACGQAFSGVERLRAEYDGRITYVVRQFPLSVHRNAENAARAAEAAARQGRFEEMYLLLFQNQSAWGGRADDQSATFVTYAQQVGLDVERFRADVAAAVVADRVRADVAAGEVAGVTGTPTFFLNGDKVEGQPTYEALKGAVDRALAA